MLFGGGGFEGSVGAKFQQFGHLVWAITSSRIRLGFSAKVFIDIAIGACTCTELACFTSLLAA